MGSNGVVGKANVLEAVLLVAGNIMGSGIFLVPSQLARVGSLVCYGWLLSVVGVAALALIFARLSADDLYSSSSSTSSSSSSCGAVGFVRRCPRLGRSWAAFAASSYCASVVCGNCAGAVVGVDYLALLVPLQPWSRLAATLAAIWAVTALNWAGPRAVVRVQGFCTLLTSIPIFLVAFCGWVSFDAKIFWESWNVAGVSDFDAVQKGLNVQLWAFTGLETAAAVSLIVRNPRRDVPIATICGVLIASVGYVLSCTVITGMFSASDIQQMSAPYAVAVQLIVGSRVGAVAVGVCAVVGCFGSLAGWMLVAGQTSGMAADDGLFPAVFATGGADSLGGNTRGMLLTSFIMSIVIVVCSLPGVGTHPFTVVASLSSILTLPPYVLTAAALYFRTGTGLSWSIVCGISVLFCCASLFGSQLEHIAISIAFCMATMIAYFMFAAKE